MSPGYNLLETGAVVADRYTILGLLGEGAYAAVYRARDEKLGTEVALKILDPLRSADPVGRGRFEREYDILSRMNHPHVARCYDLHTDGDLDILVLEYVEGPTLEERIAAGRLEPETARRFAVQLADALRACHDEGILHRDLKPANIVLHPERGAVVLDFGVAWFSTAMNLTRTGAVVGSPQYMAPEIFSSSHTDQRADVFSLGVILFEMLCGHPPDLGASVSELALSATTRTPPRVATIRTDVSAGLDQVVAKAIATQPRDRFASAAELLEALLEDRVLGVAAQRGNITCEACSTACIIDVPFCPGCGEPVVWALEPGPYAVQVTEVSSPDRLSRWLSDRHGDLMRHTKAAAINRLHHLPAPLAVGICERSARQLAAEATDRGASVEVVRAWSFSGARLRAADARVSETVLALAFHVVVTVGLVALFASLGASWVGIGLAPVLAAVVGTVIVQWYVRIPLLRVRAKDKVEATNDWTATLRAKLSEIREPRARALAAVAVARASPLFAADSPNTDVQAALFDAVDAAGQVDTHLSYLLARPRSRLAAELHVARRRAEGGNMEAVTEVQALEAERQELIEASLAHDLETRRALVACAEISANVAAGR